MAEAAAVADKGGAAGAAGAQGGAGAGAGDDKGAAATFTKQAQVGDAGNTEAAWPQDWRDQLAGGDEKLVKRAQRYASPRDVWNALVAAQNRISSGELKSVLPKDAKPEEIAAWRTEQGGGVEVGDAGADFVVQNFGAAAGNGVEARIAQPRDGVAH